mgnify:CR=1 FL=1
MIERLVNLLAAARLCFSVQCPGLPCFDLNPAWNALPEHSLPPPPPAATLPSLSRLPAESLSNLQNDLPVLTDFDKQAMATLCK